MSVPMSRRTVLSAAAASATAVAVGVPARAATSSPPVIRELEEKIREGMSRYAIPGVAVAVLHRGREYVRGFGVTDAGDPVPVDGDSLFRIASTTKTFTGTAVMRLVERGRLDLDRTVRSYLPDFRTADPAASARVTVRQLLNHSPGWLGDSFLDTGTGEDALARYVDAMAGLPQLTPPGTVFAYNNAAFSVAGRLIEVVTGRPYEEAVRSLLLSPMGLGHTAFAPEEVPGAKVTVPHAVVEGSPIPVPEWLYLPRSLNPLGGLYSSARDQLRWARFHLGDGRTPGGRRLLTRHSMHAMQSNPGPGGTLLVELDGYGISWMVRPTAEGPKVIQHGGDWSGQHSGFIMVPERDFALTVLTNSDTGPYLTADLCVDDWALRRFTGLRNLPAVPRALPAPALAAYEGHYSAPQIDFTGETATTEFDLVADAGGLVIRTPRGDALRLVFYRRDFVRVLGPDGTDTHFRADFVRGDDGAVAWLRYAGRLFRRGGATMRTGGKRLPLRTSTLPHPTLG